jgi:hypothetical protein
MKLLHEPCVLQLLLVGFAQVGLGTFGKTLEDVFLALGATDRPLRGVGVWQWMFARATRTLFPAAPPPWEGYRSVGTGSKGDPGGMAAE